MTDARALTWLGLLPACASLTTVGGPAWFRELLASRGAGGQAAILVASDCRRSELPDLEPFAGLVAVNCRQVSGRALQDAGFTYVRAFAVLPSLADARWFVPLDTPATSAAAFRLYSPFRPLARLKHLGVRTVARGGLPLWYRDRVLIAQRSLPPVERMLNSLFPGGTLRLALASGAPGPARKPTALVLNGDGQPLAFAKLSSTALAKRLVLHEAEVLRALASMPGPTPFAPQLLFAGEVDQLVVTVQSALPGRPAPRRLTPAHRALLAGLGAGPIKPASSTAIVTSLRHRTASLPSPRPDLCTLLDTVMPRLEAMTLPTAVVHGDFAPWNLRTHGGGGAAFDWEYAQLNGLPLLDEMHHQLQVGFLLDGWTADRADDRLLAFASARPLGLRPDQVRALQVVYLLDALLRRIEEGHTADEFLSARYEHLMRRLALMMHQEAAA
ncbi:MAG: phosphotransferase family protein [Thermomicrobiales bacterium]